MKERDKRRHSIIVKGLDACSPIDLVTKFSQISEQHMGSKVELQEVTCVSGHANIFRGKIPDDGLRKLVLDKAKLLRDTNHNSVFISRDMTYAQRTEMYQRRQARKAQDMHREPARGSNTHADTPRTNADQQTQAAAGAQGQPQQGN